MKNTEIVDLALRLKKSLDSRQRVLECFCKYGVQVEGWFKGEILCFLDNEKAYGRIASFDREVMIESGGKKKKVDLSIRILSDNVGVETVIELKHWLIGYQKGTKYNANFCFRDPTSVGIRPDVESLSKVLGHDIFMLILCTANPSIEDWMSGVAEFNRKFNPLRIESLNSPEEFPPYYFLGCLEVSRG